MAIPCTAVDAKAAPSLIVALAPLSKDRTVLEKSAEYDIKIDAQVLHSPIRQTTTKQIRKVQVQDR
jgi:hypothetical protein